MRHEKVWHAKLLREVNALSRWLRESEAVEEDGSLSVYGFKRIPRGNIRVFRKIPQKIAEIFSLAHSTLGFPCSMLLVGGRKEQAFSTVLLCMDDFENCLIHILFL